MASVEYDAVVLVSFGGPEGPDDVMPFLRNVVRGRDVPDERLAVVAEHYHHFGGVSPINEQCRELLAALRAELDRAGIDLPLFWGNRNWGPYLTDTVADMRRAGVRRALGFVTSPFGSYSSCRQYLEDIANATAGTDVVIDKIRHYHDHPGYVEPHAAAVREAAATLSDVGTDRLRLVFTAHSVPVSMDERSGPDGGRYGAQMRETAALVAAASDLGWPWDLAWQSRSGPPQVPWLEPDINDHLRALAKDGARGVVVSPIGFISDHLEVIWDLDEEAAETARELGLRYVRAATPGTDSHFVAMVRELIQERLDPAVPRRKLGALPVWDACQPDCCRPAVRPGSMLQG
jgi:ferrochelatase